MTYNILLPFDGSANSLKALDFVKDLAFKLSAGVILLKIYDLPSILLMDPYEVKYSILNDIETKIEKSAEKILEKTVKGLIESGIRAEALILKGKAGPLIVETAREKNCNFIVMGSRGLGKIKSVLMGSVSNYVLHHASCPVMIIKD